MYKMDNGKPYLNNCFPAKSLLRISEGELNPRVTALLHTQFLPCTVFSFSCFCLCHSVPPPLISPSEAAPSGLVQCALNHSAIAQWPLFADPCRGTCHSQSNLHSISATASFLYLCSFLFLVLFSQSFWICLEYSASIPVSQSLQIHEALFFSHFFQQTIL